jgi:DNA-binding IclR family transcriptional regulator
VVERTFTILEAFTEAHPEWTMSDLARSIGLPLPTVHRILGVLDRLGYIARDESTKRYRLGGAALRLGDRGRAMGSLRTIAIGPLQQLALATGETALLTVLSAGRDQSVCAERVETSQVLRLSVEPGRLLPLHCGASQKALLAFMPEPEIEQLLTRTLEKLCTSTITDPQLLALELESIRQRGWASSNEETNAGVWGIAIPVISDSDVVCAVGIAGPSLRLSDKLIRSNVKKVHDAALTVARSLGLSVPPLSLSTSQIDAKLQRSNT